MRTNNGSFSGRFAGFLAPFLFVHAFNLLFIPGSYFLARTDAPMFLMGTGLNWLSLDPLLIWHMPGYFFMEVSGIILLLSGLPSENLDTFQSFGMGFQFVVLVLAGLVAAYLGGHLSINGRRMFLLGCLSAGMPTTLAYSTIWGLNYALCVLTVPVGLGLFLVLTRPRNPWGVAGGILALTGFLLANSYTALAIAIGCAFGLILQKERSPGTLADRLGVSGDRRLAYDLFLVLLIGLFTVSLTRIAPWVRDEWIIPAAIAALAMGVAFLLLKRNPWMRAWGYGFCLPVLAGWFAGANFSSLHWGIGLAIVTSWTGDTGLNRPLEWLSRIGSLLFFQTHAWNLLLLATLLGGAGLLLRWGTRKDGRVVQYIPVLVFSIIGIAVTSLASAEVSMVLPEGGNPSVGDFGISRERYYLFTPVFVCSFLLYLWEAWGRNVHILVSAVVIGIFSLSLSHYFDDKSLYVPHVMKVKQEMDSRIDAYLGEHRNGHVVFARVEYPDRAAVLYGYNNYRGKEIPPSSTLANPRIRYSNLDLNVLAHRMRGGIAPGEILVVHETKQVPRCMTRIWYDDTLNVGISVADACRSASP